LPLYPFSFSSLTFSLMPFSLQHPLQFCFLYPPFLSPITPFQGCLSPLL
jgi:hypothetical protein